MPKNPCAKTVTPEEAYEVFQSPDGDTTHWVIKKYKSIEAEDKDPYARWYVATKSPGTWGSYEYGDTYAKNLKDSFIRVDNPLCSYVCVCLDNETTFSLTLMEKYRYTFLRGKDPMLVNYARLAVPKTKFGLFKQIATTHKLHIVCIDSNDEVNQCRIDLDAERIRQDQEGRQQYIDEQAKLGRKEL